MRPHQTNAMRDRLDPLDLFGCLRAESIRAVVWKDLHECESFAAGQGELDLLVHPDDFDRFAELAGAAGYARFHHHIDIYDGAISHWLRFHARGFQHLHVHTRLLTGDHVAKEFDLTRVFGREIFAPAGTACFGLPVVAPENELAIGLARLILKAGRGRGFKLDGSSSA